MKTRLKVLLSLHIQASEENNNDTHYYQEPDNSDYYQDNTLGEVDAG